MKIYTGKLVWLVESGVLVDDMTKKKVSSETVVRPNSTTIVWNNACFFLEKTQLGMAQNG